MTLTDGNKPGNQTAVLQSQKLGSDDGEPANRAAPPQRPIPPSPPATTVPAGPTEPVHAPAAPAGSIWLKYGTPVAVVLLAAAVLLMVTRNWNAWEGGRIDQVTDDAYVRGDITPLGTKVAGVVRNVKVSDYQEVHRGDVLLELEDDDYKAQAAQANAAVEAAKAGIEDNRRQRELEDSRIQKALAGVDESNAQIAAAQDGIQAVQADVVRTEKERKRQEALFQVKSTTEQTVEQAVANQERYAAQLSSSKAGLQQAKALLASNQLAVEAERRTKAVLESQEAQLIADLHAKEDALTVAKVNLGYTTIAAPDDGTVGERQVRPGQLVSPGTEVIAFVSKIKWVEANFPKMSELSLTASAVTGGPASYA